MDDSEFEQIVEEALMSLPEKFSRKLENTEIFIEDEPSEETLRRLGLRPGALLGLYHGIPLKRKSIWSAPVLPGKISIYKLPILRISRTREEIRQRIREVVIHEIGHHFGLSDEEMDSAGGSPVAGPDVSEEKKRRTKRRARNR